jgi:hypothetical protein
MYMRIQFRLDLQADKSSVVARGPFFLSVNPRYQIRGTNVRCKNQSNKVTNTLIFERLLL